MLHIYIYTYTYYIYVIYIHIYIHTYDIYTCIHTYIYYHTYIYICTRYALVNEVSNQQAQNPYFYMGQNPFFWYFCMGQNPYSNPYFGAQIPISFEYQVFPISRRKPPIFVRAIIMRWLRFVGSLKTQVSFAKEPYKRDYILQKRHVFVGSLLNHSHPIALYLQGPDRRHPIVECLSTSYMYINPYQNRVLCQTSHSESTYVSAWWVI